MTADLDTLLIALYVLADDLLPARSGPGRRPQITDAELICLAVAHVLLDCPSERRFLRFARRRLGHLFPYLPKQPGYNTRVRALAPQIARVLGVVARSAPPPPRSFKRVELQGHTIIADKGFAGADF